MCIMQTKLTQRTSALVPIKKTEVAMNIRHSRQRSIYEEISKQLIVDHKELVAKGWISKLDQLLNDEHLVDLVDQALAKRRLHSKSRGRKSTPSEVVLRLLVLRRVKGWTFDEVEEEVRANLLYRDFTRLGHAKVPDAKTILRLEKAVGPEVINKINERVVEIAKEKKITRGRKMRVDTTVVETNIRYPADSNLLGDCVRVLTRTLKRIEKVVGDEKISFRDRSRSIKHRLIEIGKAARQHGEKGKQKIERSYKKLIATTRRTVCDAKRTIDSSVDLIKDEADCASKRSLEKLLRQLTETASLTQRVIDQTRARVINKDDHYKGKVLSIFETQTEAIRKGKAGKPTEFGKMIKIQEAENLIITDYEVYSSRPNDSDLLLPAIDKHKHLFGYAPELLAADAGFFSGKNESRAKEAGVAKVGIPSKKSKSAARRKIEKARWFRRSQRWRVGCEGTISVLKRGYGLGRCRNRGDDGMERWVGWAVAVRNLVSIAKVS